MTEATRDALKKAPGSTGLKDATISGSHYNYLLWACITVEGTPVKEIAPEPAPAKKGKK